MKVEVGSQVKVRSVDDWVEVLSVDYSKRKVYVKRAYTPFTVNFDDVLTVRNYIDESVKAEF